MKQRKLIYSLTIFTVVFFFLFIYLKPAFYRVSDYLSESKQVKANTLVVEGWLPESAMELVYEEFQNNGYRHIVTTGLVSDIEYFEVFSNGNLIFHTSKRFTNLGDNINHLIEVNAYSELAGINRAHFNVYINDSLIAKFYADNHKGKYSLNWFGKLSDVDSVVIQFDNDQRNSYGDRNLFIKELIFDQNTVIPYQYNSEYSYSEWHKMRRIVNDMDSYADIARSELIAIGIDSSLITAVPCRKVVLNRTLTSALAFRDWLKTTNCKVEGINVVSEGTHARRTWMAYNKILHGSIPVGIISLPDDKANNSRRYKLIKTLRESIEIGYYWLILNFY